MSGVTNYPNASIEDLRAQFVGKLLEEVEPPAAVIDVAVARRNCQLMLDTADALGVHFRSHVKTHKTTELTRFQVGEKSKTVRLVVSTLAEAEQLRPFLEECKSKGRSADLIYGVPVRPSSFERLATLGKALGENSITVIIDGVDILPYLDRCHELTGYSLGAFIKLDTGYNRAGLSPESPELETLLKAVQAKEAESPSRVFLRGFYSHMGSSYGSDSTSEALDYLAKEIGRCEMAAQQASKLYSHDSSKRFTISVGATPTATTAQNLVSPESATPAVTRTKELINKVKESHDVELHAGAYVTLDMQQLAAHARPSTSNLSFDDIALRILGEVASLYPHRARYEALIACGSLCLGREPCRSYPGWGVITPWTHTTPETRQLSSWYDPEGDRTGWIVNRVSQEHGILSWEGPKDNMRSLKVGEKLLIWPNHCCIAAAGFGFYLVVDSDKSGAEKDRIVDVYPRWRGW
ncbi:hypothetical protein CPC735_032820 [Paecilomyces variotii No. 5]|uniref:D-serine dehydratase n=1 Tax=Byssochlamys spectabilis (strain No. 5 / NBRC 109023) TaxID=1356009 RepID=V5GDZ6_BYSSN|nr:hypothetical protein CPC735_032820 [Paecilomyces variotii No. 5]